MLIELILKVSVDELYWNCLDYMLLLRNGELEMNIDNVIVMWIVIGSEYVELFEIEWLVDKLIDCVWLLRMMWMWDVLSWEMRWEMRCWIADDERMIWAIDNCWIGLNC